MYRFLYHTLSSLLFPKSKIIRKIEKMSAEEYRRVATHSQKESVLFSYKDPLVSTLIWNMKYRKNKLFFTLSGKIVKEEITRLARKMNYPLIIPVPLSNQRRRERGYNQTEEILHHCDNNHSSRIFEIRNDIVQKIIHTKNQTKLSKKERIKNLKGAFKISNEKIVRNRDIIIFDDVTTTGTTISEITSVLKKAGARKITTLAFAH